MQSEGVKRCSLRLVCEVGVGHAATNTRAPRCVFIPCFCCRRPHVSPPLESNGNVVGVDLPQCGPVPFVQLGRDRRAGPDDREAEEADNHAAEQHGLRQPQHKLQSHNECHGKDRPKLPVPHREAVAVGVPPIRSQRSPKVASHDTGHSLEDVAATKRPDRRRHEQERLAGEAREQHQDGGQPEREAGHKRDGRFQPRQLAFDMPSHERQRAPVPLGLAVAKGLELAGLAAFLHHLCLKREDLALGGEALALALRNVDLQRPQPILHRQQVFVFDPELSLQILHSVGVRRHLGAGLLGSLLVLGLEAGHFDLQGRGSILRRGCLLERPQHRGLVPG
eukprot:m.66598 g.66598  ORF g.66598 m.66598 type:complete len:336 (+) comp9824_c0_seq2:1783-2790(+)